MGMITFIVIIPIIFNTYNKILYSCIIYRNSIDNEGGIMISKKEIYIIDKLCKFGFKTYIVGGAVRDMLLGKDATDIDITTEATPDEVESIFNNCSNVGKSFLVSLVDGIEVATFRKDRYNGLSAKNCSIERTTTIVNDLSRRDLTINAIALCPKSGDIIDPFNGVNDINTKTIRFVGNPYDRIFEDPCRIIRAVRFCTVLDGHFESETYEALKQNAHYVTDYVAPERIRIEILKVLKEKKASRFFKILKDLNILKDILPSLDATFDFDGGPYHNETVFDHCMYVGDNISTNCVYLKLAGYLHDVGKPISFNPSQQNFTGHEKTGAIQVAVDLRKLKFTNDELNYISNLIELHMRNIKNVSPKAIRKLLVRLKERNIHFTSWLRLKLADRKGNTAKTPYTFNEIINMIQSIEQETVESINTPLTIKDLKISGNDVMRFKNLKPGPEVGKILKDLFEIVLEDPSKNNFEYLCQCILKD